MGRFVLIACGENIEKAIQGGGVEAELVTIKNEDEFASSYENWFDGTFNAFIVGTLAGKEFMNEVAQVARNQCPRTLIFAAVEDASAFAVKTAKKNGFSEAFLFPLDRTLFVEAIKAAAETSLAKKSLKKISRYDIATDDDMKFDVFVHLPRNDKFVKFGGNGRDITKGKESKLEKFNVKELFIKASDASQFYTHVAERLYKSGESGNVLSETEKQEKKVEFARQIFTDIFDAEVNGDYESGKEILSMCQKFISAYVTQGKDPGWYNKLVRLSGGMSNDYSRASEVSVLSSMFGMMIGYEQIDTLAIAGLFHDIGMMSETEIAADTTPEQKTEILHGHPLRSLNIIKQKKIILNEKAERAILNHHEKFDGSGFPRQLAGARIPVEAQILSLADQFQSLTAKKENLEGLDPKSAVEKIEATKSIDPAILRQVKTALKIAS